MTFMNIAELRTLLFLPCATGPISAVGSALVLTCILRHEKSKRLDSVYQRLMAGICILDIIFSIAYSLGPLPTPSESIFHAPFGQGSTQTCAAQAWFVQMGFLSYGYCMCLTIYFVLTIRFNIQERFIATYVEPFMHIFVLGFGFTTATLNVAWDYANPGMPVCWVANYPTGCINGEDSPYPCTRGEGYETFALWVITYPTFLFSSVILISLATVVFTVYQRKQLTMRFVFNRNGPDNNNNNNGENFGNSELTNVNNKNNNTATTTSMQRSSCSQQFSTAARVPNGQTRSMDTAITQCILYGLNFFFATFFLSFTGILIVTKSAETWTKYFPVLVLNGIFLPLQGFFNFLIFLKPRYQQWRRRDPDATRWWAIKNALWNPSLKYRSSTARYKKGNSGAREGSGGQPCSSPFGATDAKFQQQVQATSSHLAYSSEEKTEERAPNQTPSFHEEGDATLSSVVFQTDSDSLDVASTAGALIGSYEDGINDDNNGDGNEKHPDDLNCLPKANLSCSPDTTAG